VTSVTVSGC